MNSKIAKSTITLSSSLLAYRLANKSKNIQQVPAMLIGGFIGTVLSELIVNSHESKSIR